LSAHAVSKVAATAGSHKGMTIFMFKIAVNANDLAEYLKGVRQLELRSLLSGSLPWKTRHDGRQAIGGGESGTRCIAE